ncbi:hypothetical protein [Pseudosulfitobacter koreensis]|uniref:Uncharacterized protein n=1 Tax=Pseudosulfitobacter koreensis TaxID=2968472 RepID=A0ABT1Z396_9RHOB|nr:hypothetical protein [Pseudosulfitobacter koreense]MCR8827622.1 hypothetical protein [Pseudosulfitobacter koreense]
MMIASRLLRANRLLKKLKAAQPDDPFASFSPEQRQYYKKWWGQFKAEHSFGLYETYINYTKWTPSSWFEFPRVKIDMTMSDAQALYLSQLGQRE